MEKIGRFGSHFLDFYKPKAKKFPCVSNHICTLAILIIIIIIIYLVSKSSSVPYAVKNSIIFFSGVPECTNCAEEGWCEKTSFCMECPSGHYQNVTGKTQCLPCPVGHYQEDPGEDSCYPCKQGTVQNKEGQESCFKCKPGQYQDNSGEVECKPCRKGFYSK